MEWGGSWRKEKMQLAKEALLVLPRHLTLDEQKGCALLHS
jgi:hypothetical protein